MMKKNLLRALSVVGVLIAVLPGIAVIRAMTNSSVQVAVTPVDIDVDREAVQRFSQAIRFPTIADPEGDTQPEPFLEFHEFLEQAFPRVHESLELEKVNELTLHFRWVGTVPGTPHVGTPHVVFVAHQDVVPVEAGTIEAWTHPPFSGAIAEGYVWGRGTIDNKLSVMGLLEAVEGLLAKGVVPERTIHFVFGHDEEVGGTRGAKVVAEKLAAEGVEVEAVIDEGLVIADGIVPGVDGPVALIGVAEKGYLTLRLTARTAGGHSSMPPRNLAVTKLSRALVRLDEHPMPASLDGPAAMMFDAVAPEMDFGYRLLFSNRWLFGQLILGQMESGPSTNALVRTTMAPTMLEGSERENVLPQAASVVINFRLHPRDSMDDALAHVRRVIDDAEIEVEAVGEFQSEASPVARLDTRAFRLMETAVREVYPSVVVSPGMVLAATDSRHFTNLTSDVYRFMPVTLTSEELERIHGTDERVGVEEYLDAVRFYKRVLEGIL
ncbi:MAG: M20 family peptidase [Bradymonadaceae bacterium]